jgi:hypothetical protein
MPSPFPGMHPYLERHWLDVHPRLIHNGCNALNRQLGPDLRARMGERLVVEHDMDPIRSIYPDVRVFAHERGVGDRPLSSSAAVAVAEPLVISAPNEEIRETFIQIIDVSSGGSLVTVIEFLSPANKLTHDGSGKYRQKQREVLQADINMVEIDLTRGGTWQLLYPTAQLPLDYRTTYLTCVRRGFGFGRFEIYRMPLRERLPAIRVPLRAKDADIALDVQALVDLAYQEGRYDDIDYGQPAVPPLAEEDEKWAESLLKSAAKK